MGQVRGGLADFWGSHGIDGKEHKHHDHVGAHDSHGNQHDESKVEHVSNYPYAAEHSDPYASTGHDEVRHTSDHDKGAPGNAIPLAAHQKPNVGEAGAGHMKEGPGSADPSAHPGFKAVQSKIASERGVGKERAGAILGAATRGASAAAKRRNPRLKRVPGA